METIGNLVQQTVQTMTVKPSAMQIHRQKLKALSDSLKPQQELAKQQGLPVPSINELLAEHYRKECNLVEGEDLNLKTFEQWQAMGHRIKKGAKAFLLWADPTYLKDKNGNIKVTADGRPIWYNPILFVFAELQTYDEYNCM